VDTVAQATNQADEPDGKNYADLRKDRAGLKCIWPAGYPQTFANQKSTGDKLYVRKSLVRNNDGKMERQVPDVVRAG